MGRERSNRREFFTEGNEENEENEENEGQGRIREIKYDISQR